MFHSQLLYPFLNALTSVSEICMCMGEGSSTRTWAMIKAHIPEENWVFLHQQTSVAIGSSGTERLHSPTPSSRLEYWKVWSFEGSHSHWKYMSAKSLSHPINSLSHPVLCLLPSFCLLFCIVPWALEYGVWSRSHWGLNSMGMYFLHLASCASLINCHLLQKQNFSLIRMKHCSNLCVGRQ